MERFTTQEEREAAIRLAASNLLEAAGMVPLSPEAIAEWNASRNNSEPQREVECRGWVEVDYGHLENEFYLPSEGVIGAYRKASVYYDAAGIYDFFVVDHCNNEVWTPDIERTQAALYASRAKR